MKTPLTQLLLCIFLAVNFSCKKQAPCANQNYIFKISPETKEWLPDAVLLDQLTFKAENGNIIILQKQPAFLAEGLKLISTPCGNDDVKDELVHYKNIFFKYTSGDTIELAYNMTIDPIECGWANVKVVKMQESVGASFHKYQGDPRELVDIGSLEIRTHLINTLSTESICNEKFAQYNAEIQVQGQTFTDVYTDNRPGQDNAQYPLAEIYFQRGKGLIGFKDEKGMTWLKVD